MIGGNSYTNYTPNFWLVKIADDGREIWNKTYSETGNASLHYIHKTKDGQIILAGTYQNDGWMIKVSQSGTKRWERRIAGNKEDRITYVEEISDGGYLVSLTSNSAAGGDKSENSDDLDYWIVRLASDRSKVWDKTFTGNQPDEMRFGTEVTPGSYIVGGASDSDASRFFSRSAVNKGKMDIWLLALTDKPIPQTIATFKVEKINGSAALAWQTSADSYSSRFDIEHGKTRGNYTDWNHIMTVKSQGPGVRDYTFTHELPVAGLNSYRFRMTDIYGNITYSSAVQITFDSTEINELKRPAVQWDKSFGNSAPGTAGYVSFPKARKTPDGNFIMIADASFHKGQDKSEEGVGDFNPWILKFTPQGERIWDRTLLITSNNPNTNADIAPTSDGGYILCLSGQQNTAGTPGDSTASPHFRIVKLASDGSVLWQKFIVVASYYTPVNILQTSDGGYLVGGTSNLGTAVDTTGQSRGSADIKIFKLSPSGAIVWDALFGTTGYDQLAVMRPTDDGGYILGSQSAGRANGDMSEAKGSADYWIIKIDALGHLIWEKTIGGSKYESLFNIASDRDGGFLLVGSSESPAGYDKTEDLRTENYDDGWVVKISASGQVLWDKTLGGARRDYIDSAEQLPDGGYLLSGYSESNSGFDKTDDKIYFKDADRVGDIWLIRIDSTGSKIWDKTIGGDGLDFPVIGTQLSNGQYLIIGGSNSRPRADGGDRTVARKGQEDIWLVSLLEEQPPLPVTLTTFTAKKEATTTLLTWQTTSETRSSHFEIQHSLNGKSWNRIGSVNALGEHTGLHDYQFVHPDPANGNNYYRLKMVDTDGAFTYSKVERLSFQLDFEVNVYPNPASDIIHLNAADWTKVKSVEILNAQGKTVYLSGKKPVQHLNAGALGTGLYFVKIIDVNGSETVSKIVVGR